ncbi:GIY-YIG nuclease family protein [Pseudovibrio exalbescens]|uniref:Uncharacterized protein n=1 Tax=Pseudovibrio exalbescens TaxID=197461 RepID=A0A1U7JDY8_9HYPH|nr:GIY-YIG nuclease family protein [Pseudovibrio exalbescens]OKL42908.1 hypothetical protein A3843_16250 [Pseudovibrio exalbescens]
MSNFGNFQASESLSRFGVIPTDPGFIYVIAAYKKIKVGRSVAPKKRIKEAKTWLPDAEIIGVKPFWNHTALERALHVGLAQFWHDKEWYDFKDDDFYEYFIDEIKAFSDENINSNSINFIYMMNGTGMAEFTLEESASSISKRKFLKENSQNFRED